eukprot:PhF_6_TR13619/c0_g1_i3/m.21799
MEVEVDNYPDASTIELVIIAEHWHRIHTLQQEEYARYSFQALWLSNPTPIIWPPASPRSSPRATPRKTNNNNTTILHKITCSFPALVLSYAERCVECGQAADAFCDVCVDKPKLCYACFRLVHYVLPTHEPVYLDRTSFIPNTLMCLQILQAASLTPKGGGDDVVSIPTSPTMTITQSSVWMGLHPSVPSNNVQLEILWRLDTRMRDANFVHRLREYHILKASEVQHRRQVSYRHTPCGRVSNIILRIGQSRLGTEEVVGREAIAREEMEDWVTCIEPMKFWWWWRGSMYNVVSSEESYERLYLDDVYDELLDILDATVPVLRRLRQLYSAAVEYSQYLTQWCVASLVPIIHDHYIGIHNVYYLREELSHLSSLCTSQEMLYRSFILQIESSDRQYLRQVKQLMHPGAIMLSTIVQVNVERCNLLWLESEARGEVTNGFSTGWVQLLRRFESRLRKVTEKGFLEEHHAYIQSQRKAIASTPLDWVSCDMGFPQLGYLLSIAQMKMMKSADVLSKPTPPVHIPMQNLRDFDYQDNETTTAVEEDERTTTTASSSFELRDDENTDLGNFMLRFQNESFTNICDEVLAAECYRVWVQQEDESNSMTMGQPTGGIPSSNHHHHHHHSNSNMSKARLRFTAAKQRSCAPVPASSTETTTTIATTTLVHPRRALSSSSSIPHAARPRHSNSTTTLGFITQVQRSRADHQSRVKELLQKKGMHQ